MNYTLLSLSGATSVVHYGETAGIILVSNTTSHSLGNNYQLTRTRMLREWVALNSVNGLGPARIKRLLNHFGSPSEIMKAPVRVLAEIAGVPQTIDLNIRDSALLEYADRQIDTAQRLDARILCLDDTDYPPLLKEIHAPPPVIFVRGSIDAFRTPAVGVVGTRRPTPYGQNAVRSLTAPLAEAGIVIVSGLAIGIDTLAHRACLDVGGTTVAVLGCGIDRPHPRTNISLAEKILHNGALVSEFPLGSPAEPHNFPRRNRIISGLSAGVAVVEAGRKSGALITANFALQQGRDVFAVPGSIFSQKSVGTNNLIRNGAFPVTSPADITENLQNMSAVLTRHISSQPETAPPLDLLSEKEKRVLGAVSDTPKRIDQLVESLETPFPELFGLLLNLELKGAIRQVSGQQFMKV